MLECYILASVKSHNRSSNQKRPPKAVQQEDNGQETLNRSFRKDILQNYMLVSAYGLGNETIMREIMVLTLFNLLHRSMGLM